MVRSRFLQRCAPIDADDGAVVRPAGRAVVVDPTGAVLVVWTATFGFTPGGGLEGPEAPAAAALRELEEETGIAVADVGPVVLRRIARLDFLGDWTEVRETFHLVTVDRRVHAEPQRLEQYEHELFQSIEWMAPAELRADPRRVYPRCLPELVEAIHRGAFSGPGVVCEAWEEIDVDDDPTRVIVDVPLSR